MKDLLFALFRPFKIGQTVRVNHRARLTPSQKHRIGSQAIVMEIDPTPGRSILGNCPYLIQFPDGESYFLPRHVLSRIARPRPKHRPIVPPKSTTSTTRP